MMSYAPTLVACTLTYAAVSRVASLGKIAVSMARAIPGAANLILLMLLVMSCSCSARRGPLRRRARRRRRRRRRIAAPPPADCVGARYFGSYGDAMFTLFTIMIPGTDWAATSRAR